MESLRALAATLVSRHCPVVLDGCTIPGPCWRAGGQRQARQARSKGPFRFRAEPLQPERVRRSAEGFQGSLPALSRSGLPLQSWAVRAAVDHFEEAIRFYRNFLREQPKAPNRQDVLHKIEELKVAQKAKEAEEDKTALPPPPPEAITPAPAPTPTVPPSPALAPSETNLPSPAPIPEDTLQAQPSPPETAPPSQPRRQQQRQRRQPHHGMVWICPRRPHHSPRPGRRPPSTSAGGSGPRPRRSRSAPDSASMPPPPAMGRPSPARRLDRGVCSDATINIPAMVAVAGWAAGL